MSEFVIWAIPEKDRLRIGALPANYHNLPNGAEVIANVLEHELSDVMRRIKHRAKNGWSIARLREDAV